MEKLEYLEENSLEQIRELAEHIRSRVGNGTPVKQIPSALRQTFWKNWTAYQEEIFFFRFFCFLMFFFGSSDYLEQDNEIERITVIQEVINLIQAINILGWLERART